MRRAHKVFFEALLAFRSIPKWYMNQQLIQMNSTNLILVLTTRCMRQSLISIYKMMSLKKKVKNKLAEKAAFWTGC